MGIDEATFRSYIRPNAENDVKVELMLEKVAEVEGLVLSEEELENEYKTAAEAYNMEVEALKNAVIAEMFERDAKLKKAVEFIASNAVALDKEEGAEEEEKAEAAEKKPAAKKSGKKAAASEEKTEE